MKRTGFKQKNRKPLKRSGFKPISHRELYSLLVTNPQKVIFIDSSYIKTDLPIGKMWNKKSTLNKQSSQEGSTLQRSLWRLCKKIIHLIYPPNCYTCPKTGLKGKDLQVGHMRPKATLSAFLKYDLRLLRPQCEECNCTKGGLPKIFEANMRKIEGNAYVDKIIEDMKVSLQAIDHYKKLIERYKDLLEVRLALIK